VSRRVRLPETDSTPLFIALAVFLTVIAILYGLCAAGTGGHFVYALDDSYISMAMAKHLATRGVWGVSDGGFSSSSSSILWPALLAAVDWVIGPREMTPLVLNILMAVALLMMVARALRDSVRSLTISTLLLLAIIVLTPLPTLCLIGLEHTLHVLMSLLVVMLLTREVERGETAGASFAWCALAAALLVTVRFEGLFLALAGCLLLAARGRWWRATGLGLAACAPVVAYGIVSLAHGWGALPNPLLLKGTLGPILETLARSPLVSEPFARALGDLLGLVAYKQLTESPEVLSLLILVIGAFVVRAGRRAWWERGQVMLALVAMTILLHMQFARTGWLYRYEAYLVAMAVFALGSAGNDAMAGLGPNAFRKAPAPRLIAVGILAAFPAIALAERAVGATVRTPLASKNIYDLQYQMGRFVRDNYQGAAVTAVDIGALNYLADIDCVDLVGLGSLEPFRLRRSGTLGTQGIERLSNRTRIAMVNEPWVAGQGGVPSTWIKVGTWTVPRTVLMERTVSIFAVGHGEVEELSRHLRDFAPQLPLEVQQAGPYTIPGAAER